MPNKNLSQDAEAFFREWIPYHLFRLGNYASKRLEEYYSTAFSLNHHDWRVLSAVARFGPIAPMDVARLNEIRRTAVAKSVTRLTRLGYLNRDVNEEDHRSILLTLSDDGEKVWDQIVPVAMTHTQEMTAYLTEEETQELIRILQKVSKAIATQDGDRTRFISNM